MVLYDPLRTFKKGVAYMVYGQTLTFIGLTDADGIGTYCMPARY